MPGAHVRGRAPRSPPSGRTGDVAMVPPVGETEPLDTQIPAAVAAAVDASQLTSDEGPALPITRARLLLMSGLIVVAVIGLYFLIPKLAGLSQTWGRLQRGDPLWLARGPHWSCFRSPATRRCFGLSSAVGCLGSTGA